MIATLDAIKKKEEREFRFHAALQGVEYGEGSASDKSFEDIWETEAKSSLKSLPEPERLAARGISYETVG